jgi:hypothetical protein
VLNVCVMHKLFKLSGTDIEMRGKIEIDGTDGAAFMHVLRSCIIEERSGEMC